MDLFSSDFSNGALTAMHIEPIPVLLENEKLAAIFQIGLVGPGETIGTNVKTM